MRVTLQRDHLLSRNYRALLAVVGLSGGALLIASCGRAPPHVHVTAPAGQWVSLFNGHDLIGWTVKIAGQDLNDNYRNTFRVEDGLLKVSYRDYDHFQNRFGSLYYDQPFSHYWLRVEYRFKGDLAPGAPGWAYRNSGIQLHSQSPASMRRDQQFPVSVEFDLIGGRAIFSRPTGDVCHYGTRITIAGASVSPRCSRLSDLTVRGDEWVTALAEVDGGRRVRQVVNGVLVVEYGDVILDDGNADAQHLRAAGAPAAVTSGLISLQSNGAPIEFRRIEVLPLEAGAAAGPAGS